MKWLLRIGVVVLVGAHIALLYRLWSTAGIGVAAIALIAVIILKQRWRKHAHPPETADDLKQTGHCPVGLGAFLGKRYRGGEDEDQWMIRSTISAHNPKI